MFKTIFLHELNYWKRNPLPYVFSFLLFAICMVSMWGMAGEEVSGPNMVIHNSEVRLNYLISFISQLLFFMLPTIIGNSIYRDYSSRMYTFLYSYPFSKTSYLLAKFCSAFLVVGIIASMMGIGFYVGSKMPDVNLEALHVRSLGHYVKIYSTFVLPNVFLISTITFMLVAKTRNIYLGFIAVIVFIIFTGVLGSFSNQVVNLIEPLGGNAVNSITKFWTLNERNNNTIPIKSTLLINRLLWSIVAIVSLIIFILRFHLGQFAGSGLKKKKGAVQNLQVFTQIQRIKIPKTEYSYRFLDRIKVVWNLSNLDFRFILFSWPFAVILFSGLVMVYIQQSGMAPQHGVPILPTTSEMLQLPLFIFSGVFNLLTFLYSGILIYRGRSTRMNVLVDINPQPRYVLMLSSLLAVLKMQLILLSLIFIAGIAVQTSQGYFRYEFLHYAYELYIVHFLHFAIWACVAMFIHSLFDNLYVGFLVLLLIPIGVLMMPSASEILKMPFLNESVLHFNNVPGLYVGFDYSDFNHYGSALPVYFFYKFYWSIGALVLLLLANIVWKRGLTFSWKERFTLVKSRLSMPVKLGVLASLVLFLGMGANVYYQEHLVSITNYSAEDEDLIYAENEKRYGYFVDRPQPRLAKAVLNMDIFPKSRDYMLSGSLFYVNKVVDQIDTILVGTSFKDDVSIDLKTPSKLVHHDKELRYLTYVLNRPLAKGDSLEMYVEIKNHPNTRLHNNSRVNTNGTYIKDQIIPSVGVRQAFLTDAAKRKKYGLGDREVRDILPTDSTLLGYNFVSNTMGLIEYETVVTTSEDQMAFSMGVLIDSGVKDGRSFYHYKSDGPIKNTISWLSGEYEVVRGGVLDIYHHPDHKYNLDYLQEGAKASMEYCERWFSPLQHEKLSMIEFPITVGTYATLNGNLIPFSESKMLCDIDHKKNTEYNHPFFVAAHEMAHYWWGHKVDPANVKGGKLISESMAEYISKKVIEAKYGKEVIRKNREKEQNTYFEIRANEGKEVPLEVAGLQQEYLNYVKGGLALTTLSEYLGESIFNRALARFEKAFRYKEPPFATSLNFKDTITEVVPDSLRYLIEDLFETITIYDSKILNASQAGSKLNVELDIRKYRNSAIGERTEVLDFTDYLRIGLVGVDGSERVELVKVGSGSNHLEFDISNELTKVVLDPDVLLLDYDRGDNEVKVEEEL